MNTNEIEYISSKQNEKVKLFSKLSQAKYRRESGLFLAEGVKLSLETLESGCAKYILVSESKAESDDVKRVLDKCGRDVIKYILSDSSFGKVSTESAPQGVIAVAACPDSITANTDVDLPGERVIAFDGIRDPGNLGTVIRSAVAFGYDAIILGDSADILNPKTVRATMGAIYKIRIFESENLPETLEKLRCSGRRILGAALTDDAVKFPLPDMSPLDVPVVGNEGHGISNEVLNVCTSFVKIPMTDNAESLNASVAASVIMWEYSKIQ